ncbi:MAG TPA: DUF2505 domain-containing protein [Candidatus Nanopelagicales bacterium]|nr:DUF2505 domain-containing protein [Candidatus Nanopelagicales bacterium]
MSQEFTYRQTFEGDPVSVFTMLRDPEYVQAKCAATGSLETTAEVTQAGDGSVTIVSTRVLPAQVPAAAKKFVGETISATETQEWSPAGTDGSRTATVQVDFSGPLGFTGTLRLHPAGHGTEVVTEGIFKASVPFVGGTIESEAAKQTERYLGAEERVAAEWTRDCD